MSQPQGNFRLSNRLPASMVEVAVADIRKPGESGFSLLEKLIQIDRLLEDDPEARVVMLVRTGSKLGDLESACAAVADDGDALIELAHPNGRKRQRLPASLERVLWEHAQQVLAQHRGNRKAAAEALGIAENTLRRRLAMRSPAD